MLHVPFYEDSSVKPFVAWCVDFRVPLGMGWSMRGVGRLVKAGRRPPAGLGLDEAIDTTDAGTGACWTGSAGQHA